MGKEPKKGEYGGECNRTACKNTNAQWYNKVTEAFYCTKCARMINESSNQSNQGDLCELKKEYDTNINSELTNKEVFQKAMDIAIKNGLTAYKTKVIPSPKLKQPRFKEVWVNSRNVITSPDIIILSHEFAKAFWGEETTKEIREIKHKRHGRIPVFDSAMCRLEFIWQVHLQQMVEEENRFDYLRKFL